MRPSWHEYGARLAWAAASRAACLRRQVGAIILDRDHNVIGTGYNGTPRGALNCTDGGCPRGPYSHSEIAGGLGNEGHAVRCTAIHAEVNAILSAMRLVTAEPQLPHRSAEEFAATCQLLDGAVLYTTCAPCAECSILLVQYPGLEVLVVGDDAREAHLRTLEAQVVALRGMRDRALQILLGATA